MIFVAMGGFAGRIVFAWLSDAIGRVKSGALVGFGAAIAVAWAGIFHSYFLGGLSVFWMMLIVAHFFGDGGFAIVGPYSSEVWPAHLRATGMGSAYGFGGLGKILGPLGLAMIIGSSNVVTPKVSMAAITPAFLYLAAWYLMAGIVYGFFGIETRGRSFEAIEEQLEAGRSLAAAAGSGPGTTRS